MFSLPEGRHSCSDFLSSPLKPLLVGLIIFPLKHFFLCMQKCNASCKTSGLALYLQFDITIFPPFPHLCWFALRLASETSQGIKTFLGPNLLIFSFTSNALPAHNAGYYYYVFIHSQQIFLTKELDQHDAKTISAHIIRHCRRNVVQ